MGWLRRAGWLGPWMGALSVGAGCAAGSPSTDGGGGEGAGGAGGASSGSTSSVSSSTSSTSSSSQSSSSADAASSASSGGQGGGGPTRVLGDPCDEDAECVSGLCKDVLIGGADKVCVAACAVEDDCGKSDAFFCDPVSAGSAEGYCVPRSPAHCLSCANDADCGSLSERCWQAPGDIAPACHVDCSIGGEDACPQEYTCQPLEVDGAPRKLCRPNVASCLDANGGFCDRVSLPQVCERTNDGGACVGQRECQPETKRFGPCGAAAPQCKATCSEQDPAGCTLEHCAEATSAPEHCGACGNVCEGLGEPGAVVACSASQTCTFSCSGENYDVNFDASDGCEVEDAPTGNHTKASAAYVGVISACGDAGSVNIEGKLPSDRRSHVSPTVTGFSASTGSAPDYYRVRGDGGGTCFNEVKVTFKVSGSSKPASCYKLTVETSEGTYACTADASGTCKVDKGSGSWHGDTDLFFKVEKLCDKTQDENVGYAITGHL